uniref:Uncharacterized protein n=2 Tax=Desertifilum tharense IPPAS B-1220 TaxID=1781255 RepID=A0A1E5QN60_9CYAN|nr:hypothetical protein BH720_05575 [Desertifilum tharense IPPAS B-1220]
MTFAKASANRLRLPSPSTNPLPSCLFPILKKSQPPALSQGATDSPLSPQNINFCLEELYWIRSQNRDTFIKSIAQSA